MGNFENNEAFKRAVKEVDMDKSGNPDSKYQSGSIRSFAKKAEQTGEYKPYMEGVIKEAKERLPEFAEKIEEEKAKESAVHDESKTLGTTKGILELHARQQEEKEAEKLKAEKLKTEIMESL